MTTAAPFPTPEAAILPPLSGGGGEGGDGGMQPIEQPPRQGRIVVGVVPQPGRPGELLVVFTEVSGHRGRIREAPGIAIAHPTVVSIQVGETPRHRKSQRPRFARCQFERDGHRPVDRGLERGR